MKPRSTHTASRRPRLLCVAYAFPPINRSGTHRTLGFVKHLDRLGWDTTVLTVTPRGESSDESLLRDIPASTQVIRTEWVGIGSRIRALLPPRRTGSMTTPDAEHQPRTPAGSLFADTIRKLGANPRRFESVHAGAGLTALRDWISRLLMTPDSRIGWISPGAAAGLDTIRRQRPDVIFSTSPYMSAHLIALVLSRLTRLPWVADFRDPWRGNPYRELASGSLDRWDSWLEWITLRSATHIVCCTPTMTAQLRRRCPFVLNKTTTILNAFDRRRFDHIEPIRVAPSDQFILAHAGQFYGPRNPNVWFSAMRRAMDQLPSLVGKLRMVLIGPEQYKDRSLEDWASDAGVGAHVQTLGRLTHAETLAHLAGSDALMLAGSAGLGAELQIPNKLFEYLALGKPIVATCPAESPIVSILRDARADALVCHPTSELALATAITRLVAGRHRSREDAWGGVEHYERSHRTEELDNLLRRVSRYRTPRAPRTERVLKSASMPVRITHPDGLSPASANSTCLSG